jgi:hypothetical protein
MKENDRQELILAENKQQRKEHGRQTFNEQLVSEFYINMICIS